MSLDKNLIISGMFGTICKTQRRYLSLKSWLFKSQLFKFRQPKSHKETSYLRSRTLSQTRTYHQTGILHQILGASKGYGCEPVDTIKRIKQFESTESTGSTESTESTESTKPTKPTESTKPTEPINLIQDLIKRCDSMKIHNQKLCDQIETLKTDRVEKYVPESKTLMELVDLVKKQTHMSNQITSILKDHVSLQLPRNQIIFPASNQNITDESTVSTSEKIVVNNNPKHSVVPDFVLNNVVLNNVVVDFVLSAGYIAVMVCLGFLFLTLIAYFIFWIICAVGWIFQVINWIFT